MVLLSTHFCLPLSHNDRHANQHDDITDIAPISVTTEHIGKQAGLNHNLMFLFSLQMNRFVQMRR